MPFSSTIRGSARGGDAQYQRPHVEDWGMGFFTAGVNFLGSHNNVDLRQRVDRDPVRMFTSAHANVYNGGAYVQERVELLNRKLELGGGLRFDVFSYSITDFIEPEYSGVTNSSTPQPKAFAAYTPSHQVPVTLFFNYGRGIASIDARGAVRNPDGPFINKLDFFQVGTSHEFHRRFSLMTDLFLIDSSNHMVYIPDDGSMEFAGPSRSYGFEVKTSVKLTMHLGFDGGTTKVLNAYYKDTNPRAYVDRAPRFVANAALTLAGWKGWSGSLRMRAINHYRLDGLDPAIQAAGHTVFDFAVKRRIARNVDVNFALDNMLDRDYWEMQNFFESRLPGQSPKARIHATPGYGMSWAIGLTVRVDGAGSSPGVIRYLPISLGAL